MDQQPSIRNVVLAIDGSEHAHAAATFAAAFLWAAGSKISVVRVVETPNPSNLSISHKGGKVFEDWRAVLEMSHFADRDRACADVAREAAKLRLRLPGIVIAEVIRYGQPAAELLELIREEEAQLVIVGACGQSAWRELLLGSVSETIVTEAPCPVLIVRQPLTELTSLLIAVATPADADRLAELCLRLPLPGTTRLVAVSASAPRPIVSPGHQPFAKGRLETLLEAWDRDERGLLEKAGQHFVERIRASDPMRQVEARIIRGEIDPSPFEARADVVPALLSEADVLNATVIVMGAREHHGLGARLGLGSVSRKIVRRATQAILVVREPAPEVSRG